MLLSSRRVKRTRVNQTTSYPKHTCIESFFRYGICVIEQAGVCMYKIGKNSHGCEKKLHGRSKNGIVKVVVWSTGGGAVDQPTKHWSIGKNEYVLISYGIRTLSIQSDGTYMAEDTTGDATEGRVIFYSGQPGVVLIQSNTWTSSITMVSR